MISGREFLYTDQLLYTALQEFPLRLRRKGARKTNPISGRSHDWPRRRVIRNNDLFQDIPGGRYDAASLEVLRGLDPVKRRPGMYTDTTRPNHLAQEVIDNAVDEAIAGFAKRIGVIYHEDGSLEVSDDGRGMPTDLHPEEKITGVEVIMTKLHAGTKFSNKNYKYSGGPHGE